MKKVSYLLIPVLILCISVFVVAQKTLGPFTNLADTPKAQAVSARKKPAEWSAKDETRAIWVVRFTMTSPEAIRDSIKRAKENGFTDVVVQVRGRGEAFYDSKWEPRAFELADQPTDFDPLALMVKEAHAHGLRIHAWINTFIAANVSPLPQLKDHIIYKHPDWMMLPRQLGRKLYWTDPKKPEYLEALREYTQANRAVLEGIYISPAHPEVKAHLRHIWLDVLTKYDVDGLHFDYVRYPNFYFDYSRTSLDRFRAELDAKLSEKDRQTLGQLAAKNPLVYATTFYDRYAQFQRNQVTEVVESIYEAVKERKPDVLVSAAVAADPVESYRSRFQDWKTWMQRGVLDVVCPMAYTPDTAVFKKQMAQALTMAGGRPVWGGIGSWRQPVNSTLEKIQVARKLGAQGFVLFSYDSAVQFSELNPQKDYLERLKTGMTVNTN